MDIKVEFVKEHKDGSATVAIRYDEEALGILVQEGFTAILKQMIAIDKMAAAGVKMRKKMPKVGKIVPKKGKK